MDLYEVHVPCGKKVLIVCKENGEEVELKKNGKSVYNENEATKTNNTGNLPRLIENKGNLPRIIENEEDGNLPRLKENKGNLPRVIENEEEVVDNSKEEEEEESTTKKNSGAPSENMAGGKKSRRNGASRKNNVTRRKGQAGGKRGPNAYMKFASKMRPQILKEHPELKSDVVAVARKIGEKWRALSDAEKKKY